MSIKKTTPSKGKQAKGNPRSMAVVQMTPRGRRRSEEHTSELQSH